MPSQACRKEKLAEEFGEFDGAMTEQWDQSVNNLALLDMECEHRQTLERAIDSSQAIFLGEFVDERREIIETTHHGPSENWIVQFRVIKSWRLVDREYVWVSTSGKNLECGRLEKGKQYLVFANKSSKGLHLHPESRSHLAESVGQSSPDLTRMPGVTIAVSPGEYSDLWTDFPQFFVFPVVLIMLFSAIYLYSKRKLS